VGGISCRKSDVKRRLLALLTPLCCAARTFSALLLCARLAARRAGQRRCAHEKRARSGSDM